MNEEIQIPREEENAGIAPVQALISQDALLKALLEAAVNQAMLVERERHLKAQPHQRSPERTGYANGFKPRTLKSRVGTLNLLLPQTRGGEEPFYPTVLQRYQRTEQALLLTMGEMWVKGVSTRKVGEVLEQLCGCNVSAEQVSRAAKVLDSELEQWRNRALEHPVCVLQLDAIYINARIGGVVRKVATLIALGVDEKGQRSILGVSTALSEAEVHWRGFLDSLVKRGLHGVRYAVSDDHKGLRNALAAVLPTVPWNRCHAHLMRNLLDNCPRKELLPTLVGEVRRVLQAPDLAHAQEALKKLITSYQEKYPDLADWLQANIPEGFAVLQWPEPLRKRLRTSNLCERLNREIRRRTRLIGVFPSTTSLLRLVGTLLMHQDQAWADAPIYLNPDILKSHLSNKQP